MQSEIEKWARRYLQIIKSQIHGLERIIKDEKYYIGVITYSFAIRQALLTLLLCGWLAAEYKRVVQII